MQTSVMRSVISSGVSHSTAVDFRGGSFRAACGLEAEDQGDDAAGDVLVDACLFPDLAGHALFGGLREFQEAARSAHVPLSARRIARRRPSSRTTAPAMDME